MRGLTLWRRVELGEKLSWSENIRSYVIMGCVSIILWWPIWCWGEGSQVVAKTILWKALFYLNLMVMWVSWVTVYLVLSKGMRLQDDRTWRELLKSLCFLVAMLLIMDLPLMLSQL